MFDTRERYVVMNYNARTNGDLQYEGTVVSIRSDYDPTLTYRKIPCLILGSDEGILIDPMNLILFQVAHAKMYTPFYFKHKVPSIYDSTILPQSGVVFFHEIDTTGAATFTLTGRSYSTHPINLSLAPPDTNQGFLPYLEKPL